NPRYKGQPLYLHGKDEKYIKLEVRIKKREGKKDRTAYISVGSDGSWNEKGSRY
ncbi:unnamed protein product, partial [marine sediment metagenome]